MDQIDRIRTVLNVLFMIGAFISVILYFTVGSASLYVKTGGNNL